MVMKPMPHVPFALLVFCLLPAGGARAQMNRERTGVGMLREVMHTPLKPWEQSALASFWPRTSIAAGGVEKILNVAVSQDGSTLGFMLTAKEPPSMSNNNAYVHLTKARRNGGPSLEESLAQRIAASPDPVPPDQVLRFALDACDGDYWLATLTCHNFLKEVTYAGRANRQAILGWDADKPQQGSGWVQTDPAGLADKLANLRSPQDPEASDRMGPWYHMFGLFFVGGVMSGEESEALAESENLTRALGLGSSGDPFEEETNRWAGQLSGILNWTVQNGPHVPSDLSGLQKEDLNAIRTGIGKVYDAFQMFSELVSQSGGVNLPDAGPRLELWQSLGRTLQKALLAETSRIQQARAALDGAPPPAAPPAPTAGPAAPEVPLPPEPAQPTADSVNQWRQESIALLDRLAESDPEREANKKLYMEHLQSAEARAVLGQAKEMTCSNCGKTSVHYWLEDRWSCPSCEFCTLPNRVLLRPDGLTFYEYAQKRINFYQEKKKEVEARAEKLLQ